MRKLIRWLLLAIAACLVLAVLYVGGSVAWVRWHESGDPATTAPAGGRFVDVEGVRVFSQDFGPASGRPVLLVHGTAAWSGTWFELVPALQAKGWRVIAIDLPPFGYSDKRTDVDFSRPAQARRIAAVLDAWHVDQAFVVGHSFGGGPALEFALQHPERTSELVLVDAALGLQSPPPDPSSTACRVLATPALRDVLIDSTAGNPLWSMTLLRSFVANKEAVTRERLREYRRPAASHGANAALGAWAHHFACDQEKGLSTQALAIQRLQPPARLIWGEKDTITPLPQARYLQLLLPLAPMNIVPGVGHIPHIEDPPLLAAALIDALEHPPSAPPAPPATTP